MRFLGKVSSSPRTTSRILSYQQGGSWRPGMFAVGGGGKPVRLTGLGCFLVGVSCACLDFCWGDFVGVEPPYLSSNCWVVLYFVASLSLEIASSRCLFRWLRYDWDEARR
ncbi:hypothetical protein KCU77_g66, partial [Aureobasidium melanogenum]